MRAFFSPLALARLGEDFRFGWRHLCRTPAFTFTAVVTLALGLAGATAILCVYRSVILRPLPFPEPERLVRVWANDTARNYVGPSLSWTRYELLRDHQQSLEHLAASYATSKLLTGLGEPEMISALTVTGNFLAVLRAAPALGRDFTAEEATKGGPRALLLTDRFWRTRLGGRLEVLGGSLTLNNQTFTIVGVLPASFGFPFQDAQVVIARPQDNAGVAEAQVYGGASYLAVTGRLKPGVTLEQAAPELEALSARYRKEFAGLGDAQVPTIFRTFTEELFGDVLPTFRLLLGAAGLLLAIACVNVAHLYLGQLAGRQREVALRLALGAEPARVVRQLLATPLCAAGLAAVAGVALAAGALRFFARTSADLLPRPLEGVPLDGTLLGLVVGLALVCGLGVGYFPARRFARGELNTVLQSAGRAATGDRRSVRLRQVLLLAEAAFAVLLLLGAALLLTSFLRLRDVSLGYDVRGLFTARVTLGDGYPTLERRVAFFTELEEKLRADPAVAAVATVMVAPLSGGQPVSPIAPADRPLPTMAERVLAGFRAVSEHYLPTMHIPLLAGRNFTERDREGAPPVVIVNQRLARKLFGDRDPLGQRLIGGQNSEVQFEIVGVIPDIRVYGPAQEPQDEVYFANRQRGRPAMAIVARARTDPATVQAAFRRALRELDPGLPLIDFASLEARAVEAINLQRVVLRVAAGFAVTALGLSAIGIYGVLSRLVAQRRRELGVRLALGASRRRIMALVLRQGLTPILAGLALGILVAAATSRLLGALLFATKPVDPAVYGAAAAFFLVVAVLACAGPAWRAMRANPIEVLRDE